MAKAVVAAYLYSHGRWGFVLFCHCFSSLFSSCTDSWVYGYVFKFVFLGKWSLEFNYILSSTRKSLSFCNFPLNPFCQLSGWVLVDAGHTAQEAGPLPRWLHTRMFQHFSYQHKITLLLKLRISFLSGFRSTGCLLSGHSRIPLLSPTSCITLERFLNLWEHEN